MINIKSSKGIFNITNSLFESIKKNNPELLMEDNSSINIFDIKKRYQDATGLKYNPNGDEFDALMKVMEKTGGDPDKFESELKDIFDKSDNNESNFKNNLGRILKKKEIQDFRPESKKVTIHANDNKKEKERKIFIDSIKNAVGKDNFRQLSYDELNGWFEKWYKKDDEGQQQFFSKIGEKLNKKFSNSEQSVENKPEEKIEEKPIEQPIEDKKDSIKAEEKPIEQKKMKKGHNKNKKNKLNKEKQKISSNENDKITIINGDDKKIERMFKNSFFGQWNMSKNKFLSFVASMYNNKFNGNMNKVSNELLKFYKQNNDEINEYIKRENKNGLIDLFRDVVEQCKSEGTIKNKDKKVDDISNIEDSFNNYIKNYDGMEAPKIDLYIKEILKKYLPEKYVEPSLERYMSEFKSIYEDNDDLSDEIILKRQKEDMMQLFNKVQLDCNKLKEFMKKSQLSESYLIEYDEKDMIYKMFSEKGWDFIEQNKDKIYTNKLLKDKDTATVKNNFDKLDDKNLESRIKELQSSYITNETINFITKIYNKYVVNSVNTNMNKKSQVIKDLYNKIDEHFRTLKDTREENIRKKITSEDNINKLKYKFAYRVRREILGLPSDTKLNNIDNFSEEDFDSWFTSHETELINNNNLLRYLTDEEWKKFTETLDFPQGSTIAKKEEAPNNIFKKIKEDIKQVSFFSKIPGIVTNFIDDALTPEIKRKLLPWTYKIYPFGRRKLNIFNDEIKRKYIDMTKNDNMIYRGIKIYDFLRGIDEKDFWNNVCVISCRTEKSFNLIGSLLYQMNRRDELNIQSDILATALNTRSRLYVLTPLNDEGKYEKRNGGQLFDEKTFTINDKKVCDKIQRRYFILLTEGYIKVGGTLNKMFRGLKNNVLSFNNGNNKILGVKTDNLHLK